MPDIHRDTLFVALTRPQMFAGVTYSFFVINGVLAAELFLIFKSLWVLAIALIIHGIGVIMCLREPASSICGSPGSAAARVCETMRSRIFDLWIARVSRCPRVRNYAIWRCNSYRP